MAGSDKLFSDQHFLVLTNVNIFLTIILTIFFYYSLGIFWSIMDLVCLKFLRQKMASSLCWDISTASEGRTVKFWQYAEFCILWMLTKFQFNQTTLIYCLDQNINFSFQEVKIKSCLLQLSAPQIQLLLTRLTRLIHTSFLPSNWNLDKIFALTVGLGQAHMAKKCLKFSSMR